MHIGKLKVGSKIGSTIVELGGTYSSVNDMKDNILLTSELFLCNTIGYYEGGLTGSAEYVITSLQNARDMLDIPDWVPDEYGDHYVGTTGNVAILNTTKRLDITQFGADPTGGEPFDVYIVSARDKALSIGGTITSPFGAEYKLSAPFSFNDSLFDLGNCRIVFADNISDVEGTVVISTGSGETIATRASRNCSISIDGNVSNQSVGLIAFNIHKDHSALSSYEVDLIDFSTGVYMSGDCERNNVVIRAAAGDTLLIEDDLKDGSPDENKYTLFGSTCSLWYSVCGQISSTVEFHVENSIDSGGWCVDVCSSKAVTLSGEIRGTNGNGLRYYGDTATGTVIQDDLSVIQVLGGTALQISNVECVVGNFILENFNGKGVEILSASDLDGAHFSVKGNVGELCPVTVGSLDGSGYLDRGIVRCSVQTGGDSEGYCIRLVNIQRSEVFVGSCIENIYADTNCNRVTLYIPSGFISRGNTVINNSSTSNALYVNVLGCTTTSDLYSSESWIFEGVTFDFVRNLGSNVTWSGSGWTMHSGFSTNSTNFQSSGSDVNTRYKVVGVGVFDTTSNFPLYPTGTSATSQWVDGVGNVIYTPS